MKLDSGQSGLLDNLGDLPGRLVHEDTNALDLIPKCGDNLRRLVQLYSPRTRNEDEAQRIRACGQAGLRVVQIRGCANLYPSHRAATGRPAGSLRSTAQALG